MPKATKFGLTWWGERWIDALLKHGAGYEKRLARGRTYARKGTVSDLVVRPGEVTARVQGSRPSPYSVSLRLPAFTDEQWQAIAEALATQIRHAAALLDGRMPDDVDDTLATVGLSLFPGARELRTRCTCPDDANPCKHVAAVHYVLAQTFDGDPFLLPELRGRGRDELLAALRRARRPAAGSAGADGASGADPSDIGAGGDEGVALSTLRADSLYAAAGDLGAIAVDPRPADDPTALLRRLGPVPGVDTQAQARLAGAVRQAAAHASSLLWAGDDAGDEDEDPGEE